MLGLKISIRYICILLLLAFSANISAQININSPYSRYAIGQLYKSSDPQFVAMGGMSLAYRGPSAINYSNPASYTAFDSLSFIFQGGINSNFVTLTNNETSSNTNYTSLSYLLFGFPIVKWWRTSLGILPYSKVGYDIHANEIDEGVGEIEYVYNGSGGINRFYWGNGYRINNNFSLGFNLSYLFGNIEKNRAVTFPDSIYRFNFKIENTTKVNDVIIDYGLQYAGKLNNGLVFEAGLVFANSLNVKTKETEVAMTYVGNANSGEYVKDTIESYPEEVGNIKLPTSFGIGILLRNSDKWLIGLDYYWQNWNKYSSFGESDSLDNSMQISLGGQFTPDNSSLAKYWELINYRFGFKYAHSYIELNNENLQKLGISFGLGLPLKRSRSKLNFAVEFGKVGTIDKNLIQENYVQISFSISVYERWFFKKKYD